MPRLVVALAASLALAACGGGAVPTAGADAGTDAATPKESDCADFVDEDKDGKTDCDDDDCSTFLECKPVDPPPCTTQRDCGNIVDETFTNLCLDGKCVPPGPKTLKNQPVTAQVFFDLTFNTPLTSDPHPRSVAVRLVYPEKLDGTPISCADIIGKRSDDTLNCDNETTRSRIDKNPALNQVFRSLYSLPTWNCGGTVCQFPDWMATVPMGEHFILYGEAWLGPRLLNDPTGACAALFCVEGKSVTSNDQHFALTFPDPFHPLP